MPQPNSTKDFWRWVDKTDVCWNWTGSMTGRRYGVFRIDGRRIRVNRLSWELHNGPVPGGLHVLHRCDNTKCVRPDHLFLGTHTDNMHDMFAKGRRRILRGSQQHCAKLTEPDVIEIRRRYKAGARQIDLAAAYGVIQTTISKIVRREAWAHLQENA